MSPKEYMKLQNSRNLAATQITTDKRRAMIRRMNQLQDILESGADRLFANGRQPTAEELRKDRLHRAAAYRLANYIRRNLSGETK